MTPAALKKALADSGTTASRLSLTLGRGKDYIADFLLGRKNGFSASEWERITSSLSIAVEPPKDADGQKALLTAIESSFYTLGLTPDLARAAAAEIVELLTTEIKPALGLSVPQALSQKVSDILLRYKSQQKG
jgi:hypothetical protein